MAGNRGVAYMGPGKVVIQDIGYPKLEVQDGHGVNPANIGRKCNHGVILKVATTNICGSDQHMVRGRTTAPTTWFSVTRSLARSSKPARTWSSSKSATSARCPSTLPVAAAATARRAKPESV